MNQPRTLALKAPLSGVLVPLDEVPDPVFAQRLVGDGISIEPLSQELLAPCDARILQVHRAGHALTLTRDGIDIMIHIGLDTVNLGGEGFACRVRAGDLVRTGDLLISFDADAVAARAKSLITQIVVTNPERVAALRPRSGRVTAGQDVVLEVVLADGDTPVVSASQLDRFESDPIVISHAAGLHARPASLVAATARRFTSDLRLFKGDHEANARSVVAIMSLDVAKGETVRILASGADAREAVLALTDALRADIHEPQAGGTAAPAMQPMPARARDGALHGVPAAPGVAIGQVFQLRHEDAVLNERAADPDHERRELDRALDEAGLQLEVMQNRLTAEADAERAAIFAAHQELLKDPALLDIAEDQVRAGASAAFAWRTAYTMQAERLQNLDNALLAGRAADLRDVGKRVLHLVIGHAEPAHVFPHDSIVVAEEISPSDVANLDRARVRGICTALGSATSHVAILARALGMPAIAGIDPAALELADGTRVILDGDAGVLKPHPTPAEEKDFDRKQSVAARRRTHDLAVAAQPAITRDGHRIEVVANISNEAEAAEVVAAGGEGVGLLRTEFLFMDRTSLPGEDEQARAYEAIAQELGPDRLLIVRALDIGGDKPLSYLSLAAETNPFLGERGIRLLLNRPELLRTQLRAVLRAARAGKVAVMFPMIATRAEWRAARAMLEEERQALGVAPISAGIMVETTSAALLAEHFARDADFFSIGTNDLTQYTLAMDRTNPRLATQLDALHPAVLLLIERTIAGARAHDRWVGICGTLASDPRALPVLIGLGVTELSVSLPVLPAIKARVRALSLEECRVTAQEALRAGDADEVRAVIARRHGDTND
jgi:phosphocarrier protein FPr